MTMSTVLEYGPQQQAAREEIQAWWRKERPGMDQRPDGVQVFRLFGWAGVGKTTLARQLVEDLGVRPCFAAYTGKAAHVLTRKGCPASTVHSLIYTPCDSEDSTSYLLRRQLAAATDSGERARITGLLRRAEADSGTSWELKADSVLSSTPLLVLDECSMVDAKMAGDLLGFGCRVIVLGDPAQLPPVNGSGYFTNAEPDFLLTEVHRMALDSPVMRIAMAARTAPLGDRALGVPGPDGNSGRYKGVGIEAAARYDQVLVGTNKLRWQLIRAIRMHLGRPVDPVPGDRIMVLANSRLANVFNGQQFTVLTCETRGSTYHFHVADDDGCERELTTHTAGFANLDGERHAVKYGRGPVAAATFAQVITTHKAQGSEWPSVLVVDESAVAGSGRHREAIEAGASSGEAARLAHEAARSWLYTAVTRASERVHIVPAGGVRFR